MQETSVSPSSLITDIYIQILQTDPYTFTVRIGWENLLKDEPSIFASVIIFINSHDFSLDDILLILLGEN